MKKAFSTRHHSVLVFVCVIVLSVLCLTGTALAAEDDAITVDNGIPVVYLRIDESQGSIEDMITSPDHSVFCYGTFSVDVPEGFRYSDFKDLACESTGELEMSIRGRGNSTWQRSAKKPFKIKLDKKTDLFGLGSNKHWVLVANAFDETLMLDRITAWLGDEMGFPFTPRGVPVDVVMIGEDYGTRYLGSYYLSENVRVDKNRVDIAELTEDDTDPDVITGGYMLQNSLQVREGSPDTFYTSRGVDWATHTPSFDTEEGDYAPPEDGGGPLGDGYKNDAQQAYIQNYIQEFEDVLFEGGTAYRDLMDVETAAKYWLVNTFSLNNDAYATGSTYIYKDRDTADGVSKLYWGPLWDFDFAWTHNTITTGMTYGHKWMKPMFYDRGEGGFVEELHKQWPLMKASLEELVADGGIIDGYYEETRASAEQNYAALNPDSGIDYRGEVEKLKTWIRNRIAWFDENFSLVDGMVHRVLFMADGQVYRTEFAGDGDYIENCDRYPAKEGYYFMGWTAEDGSIVDSATAVTEDLTVTATYLPDSEITHGTDIAFCRDNDVVSYNSHIHTYNIAYEVIPTDAIDKSVEWSSSNEEFATVDSKGVVVYNGRGEVTLTAKLKYGGTREFTLRVTDGGVPVAETISPCSEVISMTVGGQSPCMIATFPSPSGNIDCVYESGDPAVVTVGDCGVLTAVGAGQTTVRIKAVPYGETDETGVPETTVTVIVSEKEACPSENYSDLDAGAWYHEAVDYCISEGLMKGTSPTTFEPAAATTRAMIVTILYRLEGEPMIRSGMPFDDVSESDWYAMAVSWAESKGIVEGYGNGRFGPNDEITREQLATMLYRYAKYKGYDVSTGEETNILSYDDAFEISEWARPAMQWAIAEGLVNGRTTSTIVPQGKATRAETSAILMRFLEA